MSILQERKHGERAKEKIRVSSIGSSHLNTPVLCFHLNAPNSEMLKFVLDFPRSCGCAVTVANSASLCARWSSAGESETERAHSGARPNAETSMSLWDRQRGRD